MQCCCGRRWHKAQVLRLSETIILYHMECDCSLEYKDGNLRLSNGQTSAWLVDPASDSRGAVQKKIHNPLAYLGYFIGIK